MTSSSTPTTTTNPPILLALKEVTIRPFHPEDAHSLTHHGNDREISKQMRNTFPHPYTLHDARQFIAGLASATSTTTPLSPDGILLHYAICLSQPSNTTPGPHIGTIGLKPLSDVESRTVEVGYWVGREHWGRGYATEAVAAFSRWAFETFPAVLRLEANVHEGNAGSEAVLLRAGFRREGVRRKAVWKNDGSLDLVLFGMLREECPGLKGTD